MFWSDFNDRYGSGTSNIGLEGDAMDFGSGAGSSGNSGSDSAPFGSASFAQDGLQADALVKDAVEFATQATRYDSNSQYRTAIFYYVVSFSQGRSNCMSYATCMKAKLVNMPTERNKA